MSTPSVIWREHRKLYKYLGKMGKLLVWTKILIPPKGFENQVPYLTGIVQFSDGEKLPVQIVDCNESTLKPNQKVTVTIRKIGKAKSEDVIEYGIKVKPL